MMTTPDHHEAELDLTNCDREPIHIPGTVQPQGVLLVLRDSDFKIIYTSENTLEPFGIAPEHILGKSIEELFSRPAALNLENALQEVKLSDGPSYIRTLTAAQTAKPFHLIAHRYDDRLIVELEPSASSESVSFRHLYLIVSTLTARLKKARSVDAISRLAATEVRALTGFDRVLVYRFDSGWNGQVIAEARDETYSSYLHLWFPASDIPAQARALYQMNRLRLIADVMYRPVGILALPTEDGARPVDLSFAWLRSVSPIHVEYLKNMGVMSSMSMSLLNEKGELWGLIACHHRSPKPLSFELRTACDLLAQTVSTQLEVAEQVERFEHRIALTSVVTRLLAFMAQENEFLDGLCKHPEELLSFGSADGAAILHSGGCTLIGNCPDTEQIYRVVDWLGSRGRDDVFCTDCLPLSMPDSESLRDRASGLLAISISQLYRSYILWFRPEVIRTVEWSGDPRKAVEVREGKPDRLHPRKSFESWKETVRGRSLPWNTAHVEVARELRNAIIGVVLKKAEELAELSADLQKSNKELEAFSYSVSHDLRAPFRHILGYSELLKSSATAKLDERDKRYLEVIIQSANFAGTLVENLLSFSQLGRTKLKPRRIDMEKLVRDVKLDLERDAGERQIEWHIAPLPEVEADPILIRLVWQNLLENAVKYSQYRDLAIIEITSWQEGAELIFSVRDNGAGFEQAYADKLFGVFQRLHRMEDFGGTGIGLANVKRIVSRHGGRTWAFGELDKGATFFFSFPVRVDLG